MLHHVSVGVRDVARAATFYDPVLKALGYRRVMEFLPGAIAYGESKDRPQFWIGLPHDQRLPSAGNGTHVGFSARSKTAVNAFHAAALKAGGSNNGEPGPRPDYGPQYYGAFIYDLDGNKIKEAAPVLVLAERSRQKSREKSRPRKRKRRPRRKRQRRKPSAGEGNRSL